jgi:tRNA A37 methylthiotransferase MiaB
MKPHILLNGGKELILIAQELTYYGLDLTKESFTELLENFVRLMELNDYCIMRIHINFSGDH